MKRVTCEERRSATDLGRGMSPNDRTRAPASARSESSRSAGASSPQIATVLSGIEWGTFLGPEHLAAGRVDLPALRASGAFDRIVEVLPGRLAYLQVTANPADDLEAGIETNLIAARLAVSTIIMKTDDVTLE